MYDATGMLLHTNGNSTIGKLSSLFPIIPSQYLGLGPGISRPSCIFGILYFKFKVKYVIDIHMQLPNYDLFNERIYIPVAQHEITGLD